MPSASSAAASTISEAEALETTEEKREFTAATLPPLRKNVDGAAAAAVDDDVDALEAVGDGLAAAKPARDAIMTPAISCRG